MIWFFLHYPADDNTINTKEFFFGFPFTFNVVIYTYEIKIVQDIYMNKIPNDFTPSNDPADSAALIILSLNIDAFTLSIIISIKE